MFKRIVSVLLVVMCLLITGILAEEKMASYPDIMKVQVTMGDRKQGKNESYVKKEYLVTQNDTVNQDLKNTVDAYDQALSQILQPDPRKNGKRNSRLDIETSYFLTGTKWISTMVQARISYQREQIALHFKTAVYDLISGEIVTLSDMFTEDSPVWERMSVAAKNHIAEVFPYDNRPSEQSLQMVNSSTMKDAAFTLSAFQLTLHFPAETFYPDHKGLIHVPFYYDELWEYMTDEAKQQTDNTIYKMVAITCDDGPKYDNSIAALNNFRQHGARVTFFTVGKMCNGSPDIVQREFDQNHLIGSHTYKHKISEDNWSVKDRQLELSTHQELLLTITGEPVRVFRAPGGSWPQWVEADIHLPIIQWSLDTLDYTGKNKKKIFYSIRNHVKDGDIILMHDSGSIMYTAIPSIMDFFFENGYMTATVEELARVNRISLEPNVVYYHLLDGDYSK